MRVPEQTFGVFHLFCGSGGGALGFAMARGEWRGIRGRFITLGGVDVDPEACQDFEMLTGVRATRLDLFAREDCVAYHGHEPPAGWKEATPEDLRAAAGYERPDVVFSSPPCKGFSALLPRSRAESQKYEALNRLTLRGIWLALEAWDDDPPGLVILENVPRITSRGRPLLERIKALLRAYGYEVAEGFHDLGEVGGLAQHRRRYLLVARHAAKIPAFLYHPPKRRVRAIGEVLEHLPLPDDPAGGPMHRLPRLQWRTWVRLALIPAGGDWRDLQRIEPGQYAIVPNGGAHLIDHRLGYAPHSGAYRVGRWDQPATTIIGSASVRGSNGLAAVADPRLPREHGHRFKGSPGLYGVQRWDEPSVAVTGAASPTGSNYPASVADPRLACRPYNGAYRVVRWDEPAPTVTGSGDVHAQGAAAVADPRIPDDSEPGVWVIVAEDGTWHRPLTTLELAALQGFPVRLPDGRPLVLAGNSHRRWRERIGNAVPPPAAQAIAESMLTTLLQARAGEWALSMWATALWVAGKALRRALGVGRFQARRMAA